MHALNQLKKGDAREAEDNIIEPGKKIRAVDKEKNCGSELIVADDSKSAANKLITDYFSGPISEKKSRKSSVVSEKVKERSGSKSKCPKQRNYACKGKRSEVPVWCCIPGTPFRVVRFTDYHYHYFMWTVVRMRSMSQVNITLQDAFRHLRRDCSHWFLTHFHMDREFHNAPLPYILLFIKSP